MLRLFLFTILLLLHLSFVNSQERFDCGEYFCSQQGECPVLNCGDGRILKNATRCGCCNICLKNLKEGDDCKTVYNGWTEGIAECGHGLFCKKTEGSTGDLGKCAPTDCLLKHRSYNKEDEKSSFHASFSCDHFGNFEPVVCIDGGICFCVDKKGKRINGTDLSVNNDTMKCDCSRDINYFPTVVDDKNLPRCLPNGNYDPLQCTQTKCFCMDNEDEEVDVVENASAKRKLSCYTNARHDDDKPTDCLKKREARMKLIKKHLEVVAVDPIYCELDGTYSPLQCEKGRCFCVNRNGDEYKGNRDVNAVLCHCLRDQEIIKSDGRKKVSNMENFLKTNCNKNYISDSNIIPSSFIQDFMK